MAAEPGRGRRLLRGAARAVRRPPAAAARRLRRLTHAQGAGESGLGKLTELHAVNSAGDMLITVALASTIFFSVPTGEARGRVALYLLVTMAPFALLAPVVGPLLDRLPHGRRAAMAASMLARALLALAMSGAVASGGLELYPAALAVLVSSKAYGVVRSAVVPRLLPPAFSLVKANSRVTLAGLIATGAAAPLGAGLHQFGPAWPLYGAFAVFVLGTFLSFSLPGKVDSAKGERKARLAPVRPPDAMLPRVVRRAGNTPDVPDAPEAPEGTYAPDGTVGTAASASAAASAGPARAAGPTGWHGSDGSDGSDASDGLDGSEAHAGAPGEKRPGLRTVGASVRGALFANSALRGLSGFLTFFLAFLLRDQPLAGLSGAVSLGLAAVAAGTGNALGTAIGAWLKARGPEVIIVGVLACALTATATAAAVYGTFTVAAVAMTAGISQALGKLSLDALIQRDMPEEVRTSAFARSETLMQMSWVVGGGLGISLPLIAPLGLSAGAVLITAGGVLSVRGLLRAARQGSPHPRVA